MLSPLCSTTLAEKWVWTMIRDLYFIPMIAEALRKPDRRLALQEVFRKIEERGADQSFRAGYVQFQRFVAHSIDHWRGVSPNALDEDAGSTLDAGVACELGLDRDGQRVAKFNVDRIPFKKRIGDMLPGRFRLKTYTGWTLWEAVLSPRELIWTEAYPGEHLPLAAQSESHSAAATLNVSALSGALRIRVYPGLEGGTVEVMVDDRRPMA